MGTVAYVVVSGSVEICKLSAGNLLRLQVLEPGTLFGEMALIDHDLRMATARALSPVELMVITSDDLNRRLQRLEKSDLVLRRLIDVYVQRLRDTAGEVDS